MINEERSFGPVTVRSRFMLEVASELAAMPEWPHKQVQVSMRDQVGGDWAITLLASDSPAGLPRVINGEAQVAILNPSVVLTLASRGTGPFKEPADLRAITVIHSYDQLAFAVAAATGVNSLADIRDRRMPLRVSLRGQADHSVHMVVDEVLAAYGFSLDDMVSWGAQLEHHPGVNDILGKVDKVERGELDAIFDEGIMAWADKSFGVGMRFLPLEEDILQKLEAIGFRRGTIESRLYEGLYGRLASPRLQRVYCLHSRRRARPSHSKHLPSLGGAKGPHTAGLGPRPAAPPRDVQRHPRRPSHHTAAPSGRAVLA